MLAILLALVVIAVGTPRTQVFHPAAIALMEGSSEEDVSCGPESARPESSLISAKDSRTGDYDRHGQYHCRRNVFGSDERNPFIEKAVASQMQTAERVAHVFAKQRRPSAAPIGIQIGGLGDTELEEKISAIYREAFSRELGASQVLRRLDETASASIVRVVLKRTDRVEDLAFAEWSAPVKKGERQWQSL